MVDNLCRDIIAGRKPVVPPGYVPTTEAEAAAASTGNPFENSHYLQRIKIRGGAFAILMAFHSAGDRHSMTQDQICRAAQPFCDEAMEANWNAGRPYGALKSKDTLIKHGLLGANKGKASYTGRGWRSEKNSYFLTREGELFIEALFKLKPEARKQIQQHTSVPVAASFGAARHFDTAAAPSFAHISSTSTRGGNADDRRRLMDFAAKTRAGDEVHFDVSKERRKFLHRLTDELAGNMAAKGLRLAHESRGVGRGRALTIRAERLGGVAGFSTPTKRPATIFDTTPDLSDDFMPSPPPRTTGIGRVLGETEYGTPPKRPREESAQEKAAEAALMRQAMFESLQDVKQTNVAAGSAEQPLPLDDFDDSDGEDKKPRALPLNQSRSNCHHDILVVQNTKEPVAPSVAQSNSRRNGVTEYNRKTQQILDLLDSDDDDGDLLKPIFNENMTEDKNEVIDLISPRGGSSSEPKKLQILIDDRERSRNAQPRYLRMQLNQFLSSQIFKASQPELLQETSVVERTLPVGDFGFHVTVETETVNIPVCIERKRIGDLVQRSAAKDHWRQLLRGQESSHSNILLLEGDFRTAETFEAFGAGDLDETWSPRRHVINDESTLLISLSRAILSIHNLRLIQTKDEQESLRAVAAYGTVATFSSLADRSKQVPTFGRINDEQHRLADRLVDGGIPPGLANVVGEEVGSFQALTRFYSMGEFQECNDQLLIPLISSHCEQHGQDATDWSKAIHSVVYSASSDILETKKSFIEHKHLVTDEARLLALLHQAKPIDQALEEVLSDEEVRIVSRRLVRVEHSPDLKDCFPQGNLEGAFYRLRQVKLPGIKLPRVRLWTETDEFRSEYIDLNLIEGSVFTDIVAEEMTSTRDRLAAGRQAASRIHAKLADRRTKNILMIRGLRPALDRVAKSAGYRPETRLVVDMVCAELSITHGLIVFHAVRKTGDMECFVREFAFACFHYQLLTKKRQRVLSIH